MLPRRTRRGILAGGGTGLATVPALLFWNRLLASGPASRRRLRLGVLLTVFEWSLPLGVALLLASLVYTGGGLRPAVETGA